ncbi:hypothetical protein NKR23_g6410 [Pleurostoma richardsiae]|uniref:Ipa protein n=1 Tax=Pleurostoma richardsiae TaxID=41990 RepID=A0AA38RWC4_9PEZI|nr:hypothetical protein NKR23_g6410 [Pleurostoma richardsiae]
MTSLQGPSGGATVQELHSDLARRYRTHGTSVEQMWRSFDSKQRERCLRAGAMDGVVLKHAMDRELGNVCKIVPELNLKDVAESGPDFLLDLLKHRATTSILDQYCFGMRDGPGDSAFIQEMIRTRGLRHVESFKDCYSFFMDTEQYGESFRIMSEKEETLAQFKVAIDAGLCIPQSVGELVLHRQVALLQTLNILIEDILEEGSKTRDSKTPKRPAKPTPSPIAQIPPKKITINDVVAIVSDQRAAYEEYLASLSAEPPLLSHAVNIRFFTRPELVADERGRILPLHTDKYISAAFFEAIDCVIQGAAIWKYIERLFGLLNDPIVEKAGRTNILQELSNVCHAEYNRTQAFLKRNVQTASGSEWFRRIAGAVDKEGNARVSMKGDPAKLTRSDPQLHYLLRLCQPGTSANQGFEWATKLGDLHNAHPEEREKLEEREVDTLCELVIIISFIHDLSRAVRLPPPTDKKGRIFSSELHSLRTELGKLREAIDLRDFVVPIDNLKEPGVADAALKALDNFIAEKTGMRLGFLYQDLVDDSVAKLHDHCIQTASKAKALGAAASSAAPVFIEPTPQPAEKVAQRREKQKSRPAATSIYELGLNQEVAVADELASLTVTPPGIPTPIFKVSPATASVFSTLFTRSQSRGSISWAAFQAAMADLGFSMLPKIGSVYTFFPPDSMSVERSFTVHRPHRSQIEGVFVPILARRLRRVYGWDEQSFELA